jgi:hypothetical protein
MSDHAKYKVIVSGLLYHDGHIGADERLKTYEEIIEGMMHEGWRPLGGVAIRYHDDRWYYLYQAMTKE